jgi:hypothetical protein
MAEIAVVFEWENQVLRLWIASHSFLFLASFSQKKLEVSFL